MRVDLALKNIRKTKHLGDVLEKDLEKLLKHTKVYKETSAIHLDVKLEKNVHKEDYEGWASLYLPGKVLRVHEHAPDKLSLVNSITKNIVRQLEKHKGVNDRSDPKHKKSISKVAAKNYNPDWEPDSALSMDK
jgi:ribosome-associated translation inhibitor RaiA